MSNFNEEIKKKNVQPESDAAYWTRSGMAGVQLAEHRICLESRADDKRIVGYD